METIHLILKHKWYNMILEGNKKEEYRNITEYYKKRILQTQKKYVTLHKGYTNKTITYKIEKITIGKGKKEWGAENDQKYIIIKLGEKM